ncbi:MAG: F0F1 ATP synthase subunit A [Leptospiraceae bacterium]|nr:F0F1 ATP synthase subunit A [Leptospiraceae bacterium]
MTRKNLSLAILVGVIGAVPIMAEETHGEKQAEGGNLNSALVHHLMDSVIFELNIGGQKVYQGEPGFENIQFLRRYTFKSADGRLYRYQGGLPMHITRRVMMLFIVGSFLSLVLILTASSISRNPLQIKGRLAGIVEVLVQWVRNDVADESMDGHSKGFQPYILTLFFFILALNLAGLMPPVGEAVELLSGHHAEHGAGALTSGLVAIWPGMTATGDVSVTFAFSIITVLMIWVTGFRYQGFKFLWHVVPNGVPLGLYPIMWPLEFLVGPIIKGVALTIRLLANMTGGHVIILALMSFIFQVKVLFLSGFGGALGGAGITAAALSGVIAIYFLEIMVAFLQAFIFSLLTSLFVGSMMHRH